MASQFRPNLYLSKRDQVQHLLSFQRSTVVPCRQPTRSMQVRFCLFPFLEHLEQLKSSISLFPKENYRFGWSYLNLLPSLFISDPLNANKGGERSPPLNLRQDQQEKLQDTIGSAKNGSDSSWNFPKSFFFQTHLQQGFR